jgi:hypothetical protein
VQGGDGGSIIAVELVVGKTLRGALEVLVARRRGSSNRLPLCRPGVPRETPSTTPAHRAS